MTPLPGKTPEQLASLLSRAGGVKVPLATIQADIEAGAPVQPDGSINLILYAAWLLKQSGG